MYRIPDRIKHFAVLASTAGLPKPLRIAARTRLLSSFQLAKARRADVLVIVHPKSGGTWFRIMLSRLYQMKYGLPARQIVKSDELYNRNHSLPRFLFTNGHYTYEGTVKELFSGGAPGPDFDRKKAIFLARHPCDVAVSWYLQFTKRISAHKKELINHTLEHPVRRDEISMWDFVTHEELGLPALIEFLNAWERDISRMSHGLIVRYEDFRTHPEATLKRVTDFIGEGFTDDEIQEAVDFASFDNLRKLEHTNYFRNSGMSLINANDPDTFKVRRGKVGGYRDYFTAEQIAQMEDMVRTRLSPALGYAESGIGLGQVADGG